jgi:hypothetical protein
VFWDLRLAEDMLAPRGLVAVDDFMNMVAMGVNVGGSQIFCHTTQPRPFRLYLQQAVFVPSSVGPPI